MPIIKNSFQIATESVDEVKARYLIGLFDHIYWILGSVIGSLAGQLIPIDFTGIDFSMTALFVVIFIDLMLKQKGRGRLVGITGIVCAILCLIIFGADNFMLPNFIITIAALSAAKPYFSKSKEVE